MNNEELPKEIIIVHPNGAPSHVYRLRPYTPSRKGEHAGHGWVRNEPRAEVSSEAHWLLDEIARQHAELAAYRVLRSVDELQALTAIGRAVQDAIVIDFGYSVRVRRIEGFGAGVTHVDIASATVLLNYLLAAGAVGSSVRDTPEEGK